MNGAAAAATLGAALSVWGTLRYLRDVYGGRTAPHRGSWFVWSVVAVVAAVTQALHGVSWSVLVLAAEAATTVAVLAAGMRRGVGGLTIGNAVLLLVAGTGILAWITTEDPLPAMAGAALADAAGLAWLVPKIWASPSTETSSMYALAGASGLAAVVSVPALDVMFLLYPGYFCVANWGVSLLIVWRRRTLDRVVAGRQVSAAGYARAG